jgi:hypothetical protein
MSKLYRRKRKKKREKGKRKKKEKEKKENLEEKKKPHELVRAKRSTSRSMTALFPPE